MIIEINQTKANLAAEFEIISEGRTVFKGASSWLDGCFDNKLTDVSGNTRLHMRLFSQESQESAAVPSEWDFGEGDSFICTVVDEQEGIVGAMCCPQTDGSSLYRVKFGKEEILLYPIDKGGTHYVLVFSGDRQIGQINKPNVVEDNKDRYMLYLLDDFGRFAEILILFTIYYDSYHYGSYGELVASKTQVGWAWSCSEFNGLYDKSWIRTYFNVPVDTKSALVKSRFKKQAVLVLGIVLGGGLIAAVVYFVMLRG